MCIKSKANYLKKKELLMDNWALLGLSLGYPKCCIKEFMVKPLFIDKKNNELRSNASNFTGFIPCAKCAKKIANNELKLEDLITDRIVEEPFPEYNHNSYDEIDITIERTMKILGIC